MTREVAVHAAIDVTCIPARLDCTGLEDHLTQAPRVHRVTLQHRITATPVNARSFKALVELRCSLTDPWLEW